VSLLQSPAGPAQLWTLDRPAARNALDPELVAALHDALRQAEATGVRAVVLTGSGTAFSAGADLRYLHECAVSGTSPRAFLQDICDLTVAMEHSPVMFIAALNGHTVAGGLELALACDVVVAAEGVLIGDGHVRNNLVPGGGSSVRMERRLGAGHAAWLALSGQLLPAERLLSSGWVHTVTPSEHLTTVALGIANELAQVPRAAQSSFKRLLNGPPERTLAALTRELDNFEAHWDSTDIAAHLGSFLDTKKDFDA
jgi:enoyl-CoA hydratase